MSMMTTVLTTLAVSLVFAGPPRPQDFQDRPVSRIAFGSCANHESPQPIWEAVNRWHPDVFVFLGDNVYGDTEDMVVLADKYAMLGAKPGYEELKANSAIAATWDDHDYGANDAGLEYSKKEASKDVFMTFFEEPEDSSRRTHPGIYHSYLLGPPGQRVQLILLDVRTFRTPLQKREITPAMEEGFIGPYDTRDDAESTMLGEAQWKWLEQQLQEPADLRVFGMSTQFLPVFNGWEAWANMPHERQRLIDLIRRTRAEGVVFISGDTHWAEVSRAEEPGLYPLYDLTSSGLTEVWTGVAPNRNRIGRPYLGANFGTIEIDWEAKPGPVVILGISDVHGREVIRRRVPLSDLDFALEPDTARPPTAEWSSSRGAMLLSIEGDRVTGTFGGPAGTITGVLKGDTITGTWSSRQANGPFKLTFSRTGSWLHGRYGMTDQDGPDPMPWSWTAHLRSGRD
ncbi:MAG: alkaline phosphatase family protein [Phycisphaerales bacterium]|nr:alkaline phosphatase family protein [Phycisphaerales bacterium]